MDNKDIILFSTALVIAALLLYRKYFKKEKSGSEPGMDRSANSGLSSSSEKDEYEPYSGKKA